jgi:flagellar basal-body rod protein FlgB
MSGFNVKELENLVSYCAQKQKVLSKNIANVGTEDYQREDLEFRSVLSDSLDQPLKATREKHFQVDKNGNSLNSGFAVIKDNSEEMYSGINNVDIDREMSEMAENSIRFRFASRKLGDYYKGLQNVIKGGGA